LLIGVVAHKLYLHAEKAIYVRSLLKTGISADLDHVSEGGSVHGFGDGYFGNGFYWFVGGKNYEIK